MIKHDKEMLWRPGRIWIPAWQFGGLDYETTTTTDIKSIGVGTGNDLAIAEVNTGNVTGIAFGANADTVETLLLMPDLDKSQNIFFKVWWTANNTSGSVTWDVLYKTYVADSTTVGSAAATTALDVAIGADSMAGVAYTMMRSPAGVLKGGTLADNVEMLQLSVKRTAATTVTSALFMGLEIYFTPKRLWGVGSLIPSKSAQYIGSNKY